MWEHLITQGKSLRDGGKKKRVRSRSSSSWSSGEGAMTASQSTRRDQSRERRGCRGTMLLSAVEKKVRVQTERHDNFCPPALCLAPYFKSQVPVCAVSSYTHLNTT